MKYFLIKALTGIIIFSLSFFTVSAQTKKYRIFEHSKWEDEMLENMTLDEKIGQLFMVDVFTTKDKYNVDRVKKLVQQYHIGGLIFFKGGPVKQAYATNELQSVSKIPLMVGIDGEWGLAMRLDSTLNFGYQMSIAATPSDSYVYWMAREIANECKRIGIHINFAPVADINNNPLNPVIHMRSFGEDKEKVLKKSLMYMRGLQDEHILAVAKHFPGHGNTDVDSHLDLPVLNQSKDNMDTLELYPFRKLFGYGVGGVMTAHLHIPAYDSTANRGASLSPAVSTGLLRWKMKFKGLVFSDALNMKGVSKYYEPGQLEVNALLAGNDILLYSEDVPRAVKAIKKAIEDGCMDEEFINDKVRRILKAKKWFGLDKCVDVDIQDLTKDINKPQAQLLKQKIAENAVTLVRNKADLIPFKEVATTRYASVAIGTRDMMPFQNMMGMYNKMSFFNISMWAKDDEWKKLRDTLYYNYDVIILSIHHLSNKNTATYGLNKQTIDFVNQLNKEKRCVLVTFGSPYALSRFPDFNNILCAYQDDIGFQEAAAQVLWGGMEAKGRLPVSVNNAMPIGTGINTKANFRFKYTLPEDAGMSSEKLAKIDSIANDAIDKGAMPGCQVLVARKGKVVYYKTFGTKAYDSKEPVNKTDLYDIASITKVVATTITAMKLYERGKLLPSDSIVYYLPELRGSNKEGLSIKEIMSHHAGLTAWVPFYKRTLTSAGICDENYCVDSNPTYNLRVAERLYMNRFYPDTIYSIIQQSPLDMRGKYRYSDLGFMYMQRIEERITGRPLDKLADSIFYRPLGLATMTFKPREKFSLDRIIPTEVDTYFRKQLIHGDVHDPAAAMFGGVAGHAGLFSNANDLAILFQMLLNEGSYGGKKFLESSTIKLFTSQQFDDSRRGLGWDKPETDKKKNGPTSKFASPKTFGHTGFTGTCAWADPEEDLIYIFLSNRVNPTAENNKLVNMNVRTNIHDAIYQAIVK